MSCRSVIQTKHSFVILSECSLIQLVMSRKVFTPIFKHSRFFQELPSISLLHRRPKMTSSQHPVQISEKAKQSPSNIWVDVTTLVRRYKPVNMGQGFPDYPSVIPKSLRESLIETQTDESLLIQNNQYTRGKGNLELVETLASVYSGPFKRQIDPIKEILVTIGAYESLHCILHGVLNPGDEIVLIEPYFDSYSATVKEIGAVPKFVSLKLKEGASSSSGFYFDEDEMRNAFTEKTKAIIVNTPHNPTGKVFTRSEIEFIADLCKKHNCLYLSDEVYEWLLYKDSNHIRAATLPGMWERTVTCCSAGKTFNATGWKIGWTIGPEYLINASLNIHLGVIYTCPTPIQVALAKAFKKEIALVDTENSYWSKLMSDLTVKRDRLYEMLKNVGFKPICPAGGYFMVADIRDLIENNITSLDETKERDRQLMEWLIKEKGIATIPVSAFVSEERRMKNDHFLRFCFIKGDQTLDELQEKLNEF